MSSDGSNINAAFLSSLRESFESRLASEIKNLEAELFGQREKLNSIQSILNEQATHNSELELITSRDVHSIVSGVKEKISEDISILKEKAKAATRVSEQALVTASSYRAESAIELRNLRDASIDGRSNITGLASTQALLREKLAHTDGILTKQARSLEKQLTDINQISETMATLKATLMDELHFKIEKASTHISNNVDAQLTDNHGLLLNHLDQRIHDEHALLKESLEVHAREYTSIFDDRIGAAFQAISKECANLIDHVTDIVKSLSEEQKNLDARTGELSKTIDKEPTNKYDHLDNVTQALGRDLATLDERVTSALGTLGHASEMTLKVQSDLFAQRVKEHDEIVALKDELASSLAHSQAEVERQPLQFTQTV